jgi:hypothetical protein
MGAHSISSRQTARRHNARRSGGVRFDRWSVEARKPRLYLSLEVPLLSSLPGANHTVYLDFNGHVTENTNWSSHFGNPSISSPAYNADADPNNFSATELTAIENAWKRMSEDFIPFHVNVTTVDPGIEALRKSGTGDTQRRGGDHTI